jgi:crossover junction endodeoxyribonuclease RuvC
LRILALDLSSKTGWAFGEIGGQPVHGVIKLPKTGNDIGKFAQAFEVELTGLIGAHHPDRVCFESPIMPATTTLIACRKLYGLAYHTELICRERSIPCSETPMQTARATLGVKQLPRSVKDKAVRRKHMKSEVMRLCRGQGWEPANDDEADALCVWWDACQQFGRPKQRLPF